MKIMILCEIGYEFEADNPPHQGQQIVVVPRSDTKYMTVNNVYLRSDGVIVAQACQNSGDPNFGKSSYARMFAHEEVLRAQDIINSEKV